MCSSKYNSKKLNFKSCCVNYKTVLPFSRLPIREITNLLVDISIDTYHIINVSRGLSNEGNLSTGKSIFVKGCVKSILQYNAFSTTNISSFEIDVPFSTLIPITNNIAKENKFYIHPIVEFKSAYLIKSRLVHNSVGITLIVKSYNCNL